MKTYFCHMLSRMVEQVNISRTTYDLVKDNSEFDSTSRGMIEARGKGEMEMLIVSTSEV